MQHRGDEWCPFGDKTPRDTRDICWIICPESDDDKQPHVGAEGKLQRSQKLRFVIAAVTTTAEATLTGVDITAPKLS